MRFAPRAKHVTGKESSEDHRLGHAGCRAAFHLRSCRHASDHFGIQHGHSPRSEAIRAGLGIEADPPAELAKNLVITNVKRIGVLTKVNCKTVVPLPAGGVDAMQAHTPYALVDKAADWKTGFTSLVMTARNDNLPAKEFDPGSNIT